MQKKTDVRRTLQSIAYSCGFNPAAFDRELL
jgi:hypothetical protein